MDKFEFKNRDVLDEPRNLTKLSNPSRELIERVFEIHGTEWFKKIITNGEDHELIQFVAVKHDANLIRWCVNPTIRVLALAAMMDPNLIWVARANKKEKEVNEYLNSNRAITFDNTSLWSRIKKFIKKLFK